MSQFWFAGACVALMLMSCAEIVVVEFEPDPNPLCPGCQFRYGHGSWCDRG